MLSLLFLILYYSIKNVLLLFNCNDCFYNNIRYKQRIDSKLLSLNCSLKIA